jgi:YidC/Oxa1 family membrane protein insertase
MSTIYHSVIWQPLYNGLILLMDSSRWIDAGVAIILLTVIVKLVLFPLSKKSAITQLQMRRIEPEMNALKEKFKDDKQAQAVAVMALYKEKNVKPFAGFLLVLIQFPILFALYSIFLRSGLPTVNVAELYSFVSAPVVNMHFLGFIDISTKSVVFAVLAAVTQFIQISLTLPKQAPKKEGASPSMQDDLMRSMQFQMKFILPIFVGYIAYKFSVIVALYLIVSSLFMIGQEWFIKRRMDAGKPVKA